MSGGLLRNVSPSMTIADFVNSDSGYAIFGRKLMSRCSRPVDTFGFLWRKLMATVKPCASLFDHVLHVVHMTPGEQMSRIYASTPITGMAHLFPWPKRTMECFKREPSCRLSLSAEGSHTDRIRIRSIDELIEQPAAILTNDGSMNDVASWRANQMTGAYPRKYIATNEASRGVEAAFLYIISHVLYCNQCKENMP